MLWSIKRFKAKENTRVIKIVISFEKIDTNVKCYCPEGFYSPNKLLDGQNGADLFMPFLSRISHAVG